MTPPRKPEDAKASDHKQPNRKRKPYRRPELSSYGSVSQITRGSMSNMNNDAGGAATRNCWIAEALYGVDSARTRLVRGWLNDSFERRAAWALAVVPLYRWAGRPVARAVRRHAAVERLFRPLFDRGVRLAHRALARQVVSGSRISTSPSA